MSLQMLGNALLALALIGWIGYRQMTWRPVALATMWRTPLIMGAIGVLVLARSASPGSLSALDLGVLVCELIISLGIGAWMGRLAHFRPLASPRPVSRDGNTIATFESRTGAAGLVLWFVVLAVRVAIDALASMAGSHVATSAGVILLMLAANRAARTFIFAQRIAALPTPATVSR
ncbi:hypothetical protein C6401_09415 [Arthrobacter woluwensis]|uniref:hypothetical protein n=1 Tax=Arthrobacter woluwensis TaxID=156980 RepID=UPI000D125B57|nr:hypothetical protein [Arthrobacter woluwensis]PSS43957.1 hypothetical protein C6401_09415 [Arthrobacter woluwensis]